MKSVTADTSKRSTKKTLDLVSSATAKVSKTCEEPPPLVLLATWHPAGMMRYKAKAARSFLVHLEKAVEAALGKKRDRDPEILFNPSEEVARKVFSRWKAFATDIETPSTTSKKILSIAVSGEKYLAMVWDLQGLRVKLQPLKDALNSRSKIKVFQNGEFDMPRLEALGFAIKKESKGKILCWDTMIDMQIQHPDEPANLSYLVSLACDVEAWKHRRKTDDRREFLTYNALDANYDFRVYERGPVT